jgi:vitamin B12 transporter
MWENFISNISFSQFLTPNWNYKLSFNFARTNRAYRDESDAIDGEENKDKRYHGTTWQAEWQNNLCLSELILLTGGVEYEGELGAFHYSSGRRKGECPEKKLSNAALYFQKQLKIWNRLFITGGLRCDFPRFTQGVFNYKLSGSFRIPWIETWLKGSLGTGFIQPSFYQLYDPKYGNPDLKPEEIFGVDFGIEKWFQRSKISLRVFGNNFTNMIERKKLGEKKKYHNIDKAETKGLESEILVKPNQNLTWRWNYTYLKTKGKEGKPLLRQPQHKSSLILMGKFLEKVSFSLIGQYVGKRDGMDWSDWRNPKRVTLKEYFKVDLTLGFPFSERFRIFGKVENLFNTKYQEYYAYQARRRNFSFGISSQIGF